MTVRNEPRFCRVSCFCSPNSSKETGDHRNTQAEHENCDKGSDKGSGKQWRK